jgi:type I restriction enzyme, S subunit
MVYPGDFLLTNSMSFGRPYITKIEGCIHDGWLRIHPPAILEKDYLYRLLSSAYVADFFRIAAAGAVVLNLNADKVRELPIPLPPLKEQQRLVAKIDELMAHCEELEARQQKSHKRLLRLNNSALDGLTSARNANEFTKAWRLIRDNFDMLYTTHETINKLRQSILQLAIQGRLVPQVPTDEPAGKLLERIRAKKSRLVKDTKISESEPGQAPYELPHGWTWLSFGELWESSFYGPRFAKEDYVVSGGVPTIRTTDMTRECRIRLDTPPQVLVPSDKMGLYGLKKGDLLVTRSGSIGTMALFDLDEDAIPSAYLIRIRLHALASPDYALLFLRSPLGQALLGLHSTAVGVPNINASKMAIFSFPLPPLAEQYRIVAKIDQLMALCDKLESKLTKAQTKAEKLTTVAVQGVLAA